MACPFGYGSSPMPNAEMMNGKDSRVKFVEPSEDDAQEGVNKVQMGFGATYSEYLQLDKLLSCQQLESEKVGHRVDDEHLFIVIHQAYELWFKQIIFDIDNVRKHLNNAIVDETKTLRIVSGLERTVRILKLLVDQILILETMSPLDFVDFRKYLTPASGFQSLQFRLLENKLGVRNDRRIKYNAQHYKNVFSDKSDLEKLIASEEEPSLLKLVESWLERTPGLKGGENGEEGFWPLYETAVTRFLDDMKREADTETSHEVREQLQQEYFKTKDSFMTILDPKKHEQQILNGVRLLSYDAMKGALMIYFYREMPRFSQPYQILTYLMDIDSLFTKWRYNHVILVQRMLGAKQGTGGSSGYMYLRSTVSDKYKVFLDLFNLSTWLIPRDYIPTLSPRMVKTLSEHTNLSGMSTDSDI
ncbi:tdo-2 [Pristionchus pacificus]|uniref:Tryptophan 2,3-dioxygenase n=1 Tax=Pristionchus pacificus TaxID=54126 RepID=A0A2A6CI11_PRIPA|nr:tdo-2 [Pristionchus pacificus]|eukprot:PDM77779.1 tdo-2 [Pristionchus pacificus]